MRLPFATIATPRMTSWENTSPKRRNGFWHSFYFTTGRSPNRFASLRGYARVTEHACRFCQPISEAIDTGVKPGKSSAVLACHRHVGH